MRVSPRDRSNYPHTEHRCVIDGFGERAMKTDTELKRDVELVLEGDRDIDTTDIAVNARNGVVTLTG